MTPDELKQLAEFAFKFLGLGKAPPFHTTISDPNLLVDHLFHIAWLAPFYVHLAKREMEKREFEWTGCSHTKGNYIYSIMKFNGKTTDGIDTNEYIALWSAIEATGEK